MGWKVVTPEMQKAFDELNRLMEPTVQWVREVNAAPESEKGAMIGAWMRRTLDEAVSIKARRPIETWLKNTREVLVTGKNEEDKKFAKYWKKELELALAKIDSQS
jgi:hypothetical protein